MRRVLLGVSLIGLIDLLAVGAFIYLYATGDWDHTAANRLIARVETKIDELRDLPSPEQSAFERIETTFIRFTGTLYQLPEEDRHWERGGGLAVWGDDLLLVDRRGVVFRFEDGTGLVRTDVETPEHGDEAYAELAALPAYSAQEHLVKTLRYNDILFVDTADFRGLLVSYTFFDPERICYGNRLAALPVAPHVRSIADLRAAASDWKILFETSPCLGFRPTGKALVGIQAGGRMALHPDGRLILSSGDFGFDGMTAPDIGLMDPDVQYGKVLAIDLASGDAEVLSVGHRNIQGVAIDSAGQIWTVEHAERGGDELNHIKPGENHGWPRESLGTQYSGQPLPFEGPPGRHDVYDRPAFAWLPSAGTSALTAIDNFHPTWDGDLVVGSLSSPERGNSLYHVRTDGETVVFVERIELDRRIRYVQQYGKRLAVWLDQTDLLILEQQERMDPLGAALAGLEENHPDVATDVVATLKSCNECHSFEENVHAAGPSLNGVIGRMVAGSGFTGYSDALKSVGGSWDEERLRTYLVDPSGFAPGTLMPDMNLSEGARLEALIAALGYMDTANAPHLEY